MKELFVNAATKAVSFRQGTGYSIMIAIGMTLSRGLETVRDFCHKREAREVVAFLSNRNGLRHIKHCYTNWFMNLITVIIINWNGKRLLRECLDGVRQQSYRHFSTILVDNGSSDGSIDYVKYNYPEVKTIALPQNLGFSAANNIAIKTIDTKYIALLNNDALPHKLWLKNLAEGLEKHPEAGFAASKMLFYDNPGIIDRAGDSYTRSGTALLRGRAEPASNYDKPEFIFGACAGAALYRSGMLDDIGLFDEDFFLLYEDVDLSFRAQFKGYKCLYIPEAIVYHNASSSIVYDSPTSVYYSHRNLEWVYIQNVPSSLIRKTICLHIIYNIAAFFFFAAKGRAREFLRAKWHAIKSLKKVLKKRRLIQRNRRVDDDYIWGLLEKELFFPRLIRRLRKTGRMPTKNRAQKMIDEKGF